MSVTPPVCTWKRHCCAFGFVTPKRSFMSRAHSRRAARNFATSSRKSEWQAKKNESRSPKRSGSSPAACAARTYSSAFAKVNASSCGAVAPASRMW